MPTPEPDRTTAPGSTAHDPGAKTEPIVPPGDAGRATRSYPPGAPTAGPPAAVPGGLPDIPGYAVEAEIARGGMGVVYRARHLRLNRPAAIKMILGGRYHDPTARVRFLVEAEAVAALDHPHVVHVHEFGTHDNLPFFALEFVGGGTLAEKLLRDGKPAPRAAAGLVVKLADGIAAAHAKGIVHRDLKPANVLLTEAGEPKVADFGLARVGRSDLTSTGAVMGTPSYMSPEQAAGRVREVGTHSDVYALGAILYEMLTGRPPFKGESSMGTIQQVLTQDPDRPRAIDPGVPRDLETIALKCLEKEPAGRYGTAEALAADLRAYLDGRPIAARPVGLAERVWKWVRRNPGRAAAVAAAALVLVGAAVAASEVRRQRADDRVAAEKQRADDRVAAEEKRAADLLAERAAALVRALASADTAGVPHLAAELAEVRDLARPRLAELARGPVATKPGLHARLALLADEPGRAGELAAYLPACRPEELLPARDLLKPHAAAVAPPLWAVLADAKADPGRRVRAAGVLAGLTPEDPRWAAVAPAVVEAVVKANPGEFVAWSAALEPVRGALLPRLSERYPVARGRIRGGKLDESALVAEVSGYDLTANLLARYAADRPEELAEAALTADARHYPLFAEAIRANRDAVVPLLKAELGKTPPAWASDDLGSVLPAVGGFAAAGRWTDPDPVLAEHGRRRGHAAAVLVALGEGESVWPVFAFPGDGDPTARSYLTARLAGIGADPLALVRRFGAEADVSAKRAVLIALGGFPPEAVPAAEREALANRLLALYREHPDPGLHSAIDWLLRQKWGKAAELAAADAELAAAARARVVARELAGVGPVRVGPLLSAPPVAARRDWFVNGEGQTFAVVRGPVAFTMGSPATDPERFSREIPQRRRIGRAFAVATREVTVEEFLRFLPDHVWAKQYSVWTKQYSPDADTPVVGVTWYVCAEYCNWLSEREGIPPDQWCYEPVRVEWPWVRMRLYTDGMRVKPGHLRLAGYRMPTEAEWEYACRSGAATARHYGRGDELLPRYGWFLKTADNRTWGVGRLRPNDRGLFDTLGNAWEWCGDAASEYPTDEEVGTGSGWYAVIDERFSRIIRGGSFDCQPLDLRSAVRGSYPPGKPFGTFGLRPTRTLP